MNRTDRMLAILLELQARRYTRGEDLARQFEVSVRTIYRDVLALCEAGVPVLATPGYGYALAPGYFLPPLMLSAAEAGMLLLGASFVAGQVDAPYKQAVETARKKIEKLLPDGTRSEVEFLQSTFRFVSPSGAGNPAKEAKLGVIRRAIGEREVLHIDYQARHGEPGSRDVEPHGLVFVNGNWIMAAWCRSRVGMRMFRLDRIDRITPLGAAFERRQEFTLFRNPPREYGPVEVHALFDRDAVRWAREQLHFSFIREEPHHDGVLLIFRPRDLRDITPWLLSYGPAVRVLAPPELQRALADAARAIAAQYE